jgi:glycosyltransferase involved in cell wall biosynthesis
MNVLFNLPSISQYSAVFQMCKSLADKLDSLMIVTNEANQQPMIDQPTNMRVIEIPRSKLRFLEGLLSKSGFATQDIIHDNSGYLLPLGALTKLSPSKKYITSVWGSSAGWRRVAREIGLTDEDELNICRKIMIREHVNSLLCDAIIVNSPSFSKDYENYFRFPHSKIFEVPEPVITDQETKFSSKPDGPFNILYVGQISKMKGIYVLLDAFHKLIEDGHDARLTAIGRFTPYDKNAIEAMQCRNVKFIDFLPHHDLVNYFQRADLYVHPSYQEGMPRVVMEALSYGVPVVASDLPGIRTIDNTGQLIHFMKNYSAGALKNILSSEISCPRKNRNFFQDSRERMWEFSPDIIADKLFKIYKRL